MATGGGSVSAEAEGFRKCSELMYNAIDDLESLAWSCFSKGMISSETRSKVGHRSFAKGEKANILLEAIESKIKTSPESFYQLIEILPDDQLKGKLLEAVGKHSPYKTGTQKGSTSILLASLKEKLVKLKSLMDSDTSHEDIAPLIKNAIEAFIRRSIELKVPLDDIKRDLASMSILMNESEQSWSINRADDLAMASTVRLDDVCESLPATKDKKLLFTKDIVYHASLCCLLASTVIDKKQLVTTHNRHLLEEVSISKPREGEVDRYLIARYGKTYYVAFKGELILENWKKQFKSFEEGIHVQSGRIPLRFFIEQLNHGFKLVLTGFSFGGLLACSVTARLFQQPYLTSDQLAGSLMCITFGQPLISMQEIKETAHRLPLFKSVLHCIFTEDDIFPHLMRYTELELSTFSDDVPQLVRKKPLSSDVFEHLSKMHSQKTSPSMDTARHTADYAVTMKKLLTAVKSQIELLSSDSPSDDDFFSVQLESDNVYRIYNEHLELNKLPKTQISEYLGLFSNTQIDDLPTSFFANHSMILYYLKITKGYLECPPEYTFPPPQTRDIRDVALLKPSVQSVSFHRHGKELAVVVEGDNLWFCYNINVGFLKNIKTEAENVTRRSIQFNYTPQSESDFHTEETIGVKLLSQFSNPIRRPAIQVKKKVYEFTFRQQQLAKLTPSELIELAYMSALLEQHPFGEFKPLSQRFALLRNFLEKIGSVVPLESILYAIAGGEPDVAVVCCEMLKESKVSIPQSICSLAGVNRAIHRLETDEKINLFQSGLFKMEKLMAAQQSISTRLNLVERLSEDRVEGFPDSRASFHKEHKKFLRAFYNACDKQKDQKKTGQAPIPFKYKHRFLDVKDIQSQSVLLSYFVSNQMFENCSKASQTSFLQKLKQEMSFQLNWLHQEPVVICSLNIELLYPITKRSDFFQSPLDILRSGREKLAELSVMSLTSGENQATLEAPKNLSELFNSKMLEVINKIRFSDLRICTTLLGAFMEEQMQVPLKESSHATAKAISSVISSAATGVWFLFSLVLPDINNLLATIPNYELLVQVKDYIKGIFSEHTVTTEKMYAGKLQFIVQGLEKTVSCNSQYISYSLERQLVALCDQLNITADTSTKTLVEEWDSLFKKDVLSLVIPSHRPLVARWIRWALMIHNLREMLAKYTAVGVVGLVNSGKSRLVNSLFKIQIPVGTTERKRTTVPFLYNLDEVVEGLDVIDFPGVDDRDETIPDLADLLLSLAQVVVFVVDYRRVHTESARHWLDRLEEDSVQLLVCLTFADQLYEELMSDDGTHPPPEIVKKEINTQLDMIKEKLGDCPSRTVKFFSFSQSKASVLNTPSGRQILQDVGIHSPVHVGEWLVETFHKHLDQEGLASRLCDFIHKDQDLHPISPDAQPAAATP